MKEVKSPSKKLAFKLPPQKSATDTSNWEKRNVSAPVISNLTKKRTVRELEFMGNKNRSQVIVIDDKQSPKKQTHSKKNTK